MHEAVAVEFSQGASEVLGDLEDFAKRKSAFQLQIGGQGARTVFGGVQFQSIRQLHDVIKPAFGGGGDESKMLLGECPA